jgi:hypothetical protein
MNNRAQSGLVVAAPGLGTGNIDASARLDVYGGEANIWKNVSYNYPGTTCSVDVMAGFRYLVADGDVDIGSISVYNPTIPAGSLYAPLAGNRLQEENSFSAHNNFYGGQVGVSCTEWIANLVSVQGSFKVALGDTSEDLTIQGGQLRTFANGTTAVSTGGIYALPTNIGSYHVDKFAQVPEAEVKLSCPVGNHLTLSTGFSALYWTRLLRPGEQIDRDIDITQIPNFPIPPGTTPTGLGTPGVPFRQSDLWVLGITIGAELKW